MATMQEFLTALADRSDVVHVGDPWPSEAGVVQNVMTNGSIDATKVAAFDAPRRGANLMARRRVQVYRTDAAGGKIREFHLDFGVLFPGTANEVVVENGAGTASEPANPADAFKAAAETWIGTNVGSVDANIKKWWITSVDEDLLIARVMTIYDDGQGGYLQKPFIAIKVGPTVTMRPDTTAG